MKRELDLFIEDILESIKLIEKYTKNVSKPNLNNNQKLKDSVVRRLEIIGEAVKNIPDDFREKYPEIQWRKIAGLRDVIIHAYFNIDINITWDIIKHDLPDLKQKILKIKNDIEKEQEETKKESKKEELR